MAKQEEPKLPEYELTEVEQIVAGRFISKIGDKQREIQNLQQMLNEELAEIIAKNNLPPQMVLDRSTEKWKLIHPSKANSPMFPPGGVQDPLAEQPVLDQQIPDQPSGKSRKKK